MKRQHYKHTEISRFFFYSVIFIHKLDIIEKEYVIMLQIFSAAILPIITKLTEEAGLWFTD